MKEMYNSPSNHILPYVTDRGANLLAINDKDT